MWSKIKISCALVLSFCIFTVQTHANEIQFVSSLEMVNQFERAEAERDLKEIVSDEKVRALLMDQGISPKEIETKIAGLSDSELSSLHSEISMAKQGGILYAIVLVLLIIFLAQRI